MFNRKAIITSRVPGIVNTITENKECLMYDVKAGTQTDTRVRLKGKGVPSLRNKDLRGDHYVTLVVQTPEHLSAEAKELLRKFDEATEDSLHAAERVNSGEAPHKEKKKRGFFNKDK